MKRLVPYNHSFLYGRAVIVRINYFKRQGIKSIKIQQDYTIEMWIPAPITAPVALLGREIKAFLGCAANRFNR